MRLLITAIIIAALNPVQAETTTVQATQQTTYKIENANTYSERLTEFSPSLKIETGRSNNPVQLPEKVLDSGYVQLDPEIGVNLELLKDKLFLFSNLKGSLKKYKDDSVEEIKGQRTIQLDVGVSSFITEDHEVGATFSRVNNKSSTLNFLSTGLDEKNGRDIRFDQDFVEAYYSFNQPKYFVEFSGNFVQKKHDSLVQDDVVNASGDFDEFKDDYTQVGTKIKINYSLSETSQVFLEPTYSKRKYKQRSARFTEGTTNQGGNPLLEELHRGVGLGYELNGDALNLKVKTVYTKEKDLVFKAHNANSYGFEAEAVLPVGSLFKVKTKYNWAQKDYTFFVTNPQNNPTSRDLRKDIDSSLNIGLSKQIKNLLLEADYNKVQKDSNYKPFNSVIGSQYDEDIFKIGLTLKL